MSVPMHLWYRFLLRWPAIRLRSVVAASTLLGRYITYHSFPRAFFDIFTSFHLRNSQSLHSQNLSRVSNIFMLTNRQKKTSDNWCAVCKFVTRKIIEMSVFGDFWSKRRRNAHRWCILTLFLCIVLLSIYQCISIPSLKFVFWTRCVFGLYYRNRMFLAIFEGKCPPKGFRRLFSLGAQVSFTTSNSVVNSVWQKKWRKIENPTIMAITYLL